MVSQVFVHYGVGGWFITINDQLLRYNKDGSVVVYRLKHNARVAAKAIADLLGAELTITRRYTTRKGRKGQIMEKDSFGHDDPNVKG